MSLTHFRPTRPGSLIASVGAAAFAGNQIVEFATNAKRKFGDAFSCDNDLQACYQKNAEDSAAKRKLEKENADLKRKLREKIKKSKAKRQLFPSFRIRYNGKKKRSSRYRKARWSKTRRRYRKKRLRLY